MFGIGSKRSNIGTWSKMTALSVGLGIASYALRRNQGRQNKNLLLIPGNNEGKQS